jgi:rubrerythrin
VTHEPADCRGPLYGENPFEDLCNSIEQQSVLYRCEVCGALWKSQERATKQISAEQAEAEFPGDR